VKFYMEIFQNFYVMSSEFVVVRICIGGNYVRKWIAKLCNYKFKHLKGSRCHKFFPEN
jgi:hypothetical protein